MEVFLTKRPENDEYYPNMLHSPGTILRASDRPGSYLDAFERVQKNELGVDFMSPPKFGRFYDARNLPDDLVPHHYILIAKVLDHYPRP